jgi:hypothetical protein
MKRINQNSRMNVKKIEVTNHKLKSLRAYSSLLTALRLDIRIPFPSTPNEAKIAKDRTKWRRADSGTTLHSGLFVL